MSPTYCCTLCTLGSIGVSLVHPKFLSESPIRFDFFTKFYDKAHVAMIISHTAEFS